MTLLEWAQSVALKSTLVLAFALVLSRVLRRNPIASSRMWLFAFWALAVAILPYGLVPLPIREIVASQIAPWQVHELSAGFAPLDTAEGRPLAPSAASVAIGIFVFGVLAVLAGKGYVTWRFLRSTEQCQDPSLVALNQDLCERVGLREVPFVLISDAIKSPCLAGLFNPIVVFPARDLAMTEAERRMVMAHELSHLRAHDNWRIGFYALISVLYAWHPLLWPALKRARLAMEMAADARTVDLQGDRDAYIRLLASRQTSLSDFAPAGFFGGSALLARSRALLAGARPNRWGNILPLALLPLALPFGPTDRFAKQRTAEELSPYEVVFDSKRNGRTGLYRMWLDGTGAVPLPPVFEGASCPSVSPDGRWLAYTKGDLPNRDIFVARLDGTGERRIVGWKGRDDQPMVSPDGRRILFMSETDGWNIYLYDIASGRTRHLRPGYEARWHPSGRRILFSRGRDGYQNLWSVDLDGRGLVPLTQSKGIDSGAYFSADGRYVYYTAYWPWDFNVFALDLERRSVQQLTSNPESDGEAALMPVGDYVVYTTQILGKPQIGRMRRDGSEQVVLTREGTNSWPTFRMGPPEDE